jgi:hypothetical protein
MPGHQNLQPDVLHTQRSPDVGAEIDLQPFGIESDVPLRVRRPSRQT